MPERKLPEPWLQGTLPDVSRVPRAVLHALELAGEDLERWCGPLNDEQLNQRLGGIAPVAFHLSHISRSLDRLLTYAEGAALTPQQLAALKSELDPGATREQLFAELSTPFANTACWVRDLAHAELEAPRKVGRKNPPTTLGGLMVHIADHTPRHVGQAITTAKILTSKAP